MRGAGMVVVSLKGVNFGFWYNFGCSGHGAIIVVAKVSFRVVNEEIENIHFICIFFVRFIYSIHVIEVFYDTNN